MSSVNDLLVQLLDLAQEFMEQAYTLSSTLIWWFVTPLEDIIAYYDPMNISGIFTNIFTNPLFYYFKQYSFLQLTLGVGIGFYLLYQFATWLANLVT